MGCRNTFLQRRLQKAFGWFGNKIGRWPLPFLIIPPVICLALSAGILKSEVETDIVTLFTPTNGPAKIEQKIINRLFPFDNNRTFSAKRRADLGGFILTFIVNETGNVYSHEGKKVSREIEEVVKSVQVGNKSYKSLCARLREDCAFVNPLTVIDEINQFGLLYNPFHTDIVPRFPLTEGQGMLNRPMDMTFLGGVNTTEAGDIISAKSGMIPFFLQKSDKEFIGLCLEALLKLNSSVVKRYPGVKLAVFTTFTIEEELIASTTDVIPRFAITIILGVAFACFNCMSTDWVRSKPFLGILACLASLLALGASFGLVSLCGVLLAPIVGSSPFLVLAVGIDDMFVMLSAWRATDPAQSPPERLSRCMSDAAVSITITTVTDVLGFGIGALIPFPAVQVFCLVTGLALAFTYLLMITFLAAYMALDGRREAAKRHAIVCVKTTPPSQASERSCAYRLLCTGGQEDSRDTLMTRFFRERYGPLLMRRGSRVVVMVLYVCYLAAAIYGVTTLEEGLELSDLSADDGYSKLFFEVEYKYYREYGMFVSVAVEAPLDYSNPQDRARVEELLQKFESNWCFHGANQTISWLRHFNKVFPVQSTNATIYVKQVRKFMEGHKMIPYFLDIAFEDDKISATRYLVRQKNVDTTQKDKECMLEARRIASESDLQVTAFNFFFVHFDQFLYILPGTLQNMGIAMLCMLVVSLLLIPNPMCAVWVVLSILSIEVGVVGYMALWGVKLHSISMVCLIICIGFCVDYSAHITYAYSISQSPRVPNALGLLGVPIVQGGLSTLIGIVGLTLFNSPIFRMYFKIMCLVIVFGLVHGVVFLPVWLDIPYCCGGFKACQGSEKKQKKEEDCERELEGQERELTSFATSDKPDGLALKIGVRPNELENEGLKESFLAKNSGDPKCDERKVPSDQNGTLESNQVENVDEKDSLLTNNNASGDGTKVQSEYSNQLRV